MRTPIFLLVALLSGTALGQGSDDCATADPIAGTGSFPFSTLGSTDSGLIGTCSSAPSSDVWFAWTSGADTDYLFAICNTNYDAVVAVYDACGGNELGCEDAEGCTPSLFDVELIVTGLAPNTTYLIQLDGWTGLEGTGTLEISALLGTPPNDECANATPIAGTGTFPVTTVNSTSSASTPSCGSGPSSDVWYRWTSGTAADYHVSICTTTFDAVFTLYDACGGTELACEDAVGCTSSLFDLELDVFGLTPNTDYIIQIDGWQGMEGVATLQIDSLLPPMNDDCAQALPISGTGFFEFDTQSATTDGLGDLACLDFGTDQIESDAWFHWTAPATGLYSLSTWGYTELDTRVAVYDAQPCPPVNALACDDDACQFQSRLEFQAAQGQGYLVRVGSFSTTAKGEGFFELVPVARPSNDDCVNATPIAGAGPFSFDNRRATTDGPPDALCQHFGSDQIESDVWYAWTASTTGPMQVSTCGGTTLDTRVAVHGGSACPASGPLACADNECGVQSSARFDAVSGQTYLVRIGSFGDVYQGSGEFVVDVPPAPPNDDCANATAIAGTGLFAFDNLGATTDGLGDAACSTFSEAQVHNDVWFRWTAATAAQVRIETCASTGLDTRIAVYADQACPPVAPIACDDDSCSLQSQVTFSSVAGSSYLIRVGSFASTSFDTGDFTLTQDALRAFCWGDGSGTACPCNNNSPPGLGAGCVNSFGTGASVRATGNPALTNDTLTLVGSGMGPTAPALFFQGDAQLGGGNGTVFGDGLRCVGGTVRRLGTHISSGGSAAFGFGTQGDPLVSVAGQLPPQGGTRYYQVWYRNPQAFCTADAFNLSNGLGIAWVP